MQFFFIVVLSAIIGVFFTLSILLATGQKGGAVISFASLWVRLPDSFYARFGIAIFITLCLNIIANAIETIENPTADRNIRLNEVDDGKYCAIPWIFNND